MTDVKLDVTLISDVTWTYLMAVPSRGSCSHKSCLTPPTGLLLLHLVASVKPYGAFVLKPSLAPIVFHLPPESYYFLHLSHARLVMPIPKYDATPKSLMT